VLCYDSFSILNPSLETIIRNYNLGVPPIVSLIVSGLLAIIETIIRNYNDGFFIRSSISFFRSSSFETIIRNYNQPCPLGLRGSADRNNNKKLQDSYSTRGYYQLINVRRTYETMIRNY